VGHLTHQWGKIAPPVFQICPPKRLLGVSFNYIIQLQIGLINYTYTGDIDEFDVFLLTPLLEFLK